MIAQKVDSPTVDSINQNNCPMRWQCDSFYSVLVKQVFKQKTEYTTWCVQFDTAQLQP